MSYELFQQGPAVYLPILLFSLIITVLAYGAFPFIFAKTRNAPITKKKYRRLCYGINFAVLIVFMIINGSASNGAPYLLWTCVFSIYGAKILSSRGIMTDGDYLKDDPNRVTVCKSCGYRDENFFNACPKCGKYAKEYVYLNEDTSVDTPKISPDPVADSVDQMKAIPETPTTETPKIMPAQSDPLVSHPRAAAKPSAKYCSRCGNMIDPISKKCQGCGKQYFKGISLKTFLICTLVFCLISSLVLNIVLVVKLGKKPTYIVQDPEEDFYSWLDKQELQEKADFMDTYIVLVEDDGTNMYHKFGCSRFKEESFWAFNVEAAIFEGYNPCPYCCD